MLRLRGCTVSTRISLLRLRKRTITALERDDALESADDAAGDGGIPSITAMACAAARREFAALAADAPVEDVIRPLQAVWAALERLPVDHALYLPPIYDGGPGQRALLCELVAKLDRRMRGGRRRHDTDHAVLGGVEGTGKTTLAKALAVGAAVCSEDYLLAYFDAKQVMGALESLTTPIHDTLLAELAVRYRDGAFDGQFGTLHSPEALTAADALNMLGSAPQPLRLGIVCDEVQHLFMRDATVTDPRVTYVCSLEAFAKHIPSALLLLTGSSANLRTLLFVSTRDSAFANYVDFNRSLCNYYNVSALRTAEDLMPYFLCKGGRANALLCGGALETYRDKLIARAEKRAAAEAGDEAEDDDTDSEASDDEASAPTSGAGAPKKQDKHLNCVTAYAEYGFLKVARCLLQLEGVQVSLGTLVVTVTKGDNRRALKSLEKWDARISVPSAFLAAVCPGVDVGRIKMDYAVVLHSGAEWLLDLLEEPLRALWVA
jgi:hypothetical protein